MLFEKLQVWKRASRLACDIIEVFECNRNFALKDQIFRSSLSIPSNIAEGEERETLKEKVRFYYYAKGSCGEVITQLQIAIKTSQINKQEGLRMLKEAKQIAKILASIINKDKRNLKA
jgi:four helix bundle protein